MGGFNGVGMMRLEGVSPCFCVCRFSSFSFYFFSFFVVFKSKQLQYTGNGNSTLTPSAPTPFTTSRILRETLRDFCRPTKHRPKLKTIGKILELFFVRMCCSSITFLMQEP